MCRLPTKRTSRRSCAITLPASRVCTRMTDAARLDQRQAIFQLAHESIHLLAPTGGQNAPVIEEGLATAFSHEMSPRYGGYNISTLPQYLMAERYLQQFLSIDPDGIGKIRNQQPCFAKIT